MQDSTNGRGTQLGETAFAQAALQGGERPSRRPILLAVGVSLQFLDDLAPGATPIGHFAPSSGCDEQRGESTMMKPSHELAHALCLLVASLFGGLREGLSLAQCQQCLGSPHAINSFTVCFDHPLQFLPFLLAQCSQRLFLRGGHLDAFSLLVLFDQSFSSCSLSHRLTSFSQNLSAHQLQTGNGVRF